MQIRRPSVFLYASVVGDRRGGGEWRGEERRGVLSTAESLSGAGVESVNVVLGVLGVLEVWGSDWI